jgi:hypothetical protein
MKSLTSLLTIPYDGLKALSYVFHYEKPADYEAPYAVWQETGESDFASDNRKSERALEGVIDFYTQTENDSKLDEIEGKLELMGAGWSLTSISYEEQTQLIHFHWEWSVS